jgi:hypothetical protein
MAAVITATGTWTTPDVKAQDVGGSGVTFRNAGGDDFDSRASIQRGKNLFDEVQQFVALVAAAQGYSGTAAIDQILACLHDMRRQPNMGERVFSQ